MLVKLPQISKQWATCTQVKREKEKRNEKKKRWWSPSRNKNTTTKEHINRVRNTCSHLWWLPSSHCGLVGPTWTWQTRGWPSTQTGSDPLNRRWCISLWDWTHTHRVFRVIPANQDLRRGQVLDRPCQGDSWSLSDEGGPSTLYCQIFLESHQQTKGEKKSGHGKVVSTGQTGVGGWGVGGVTLLALGFLTSC